MSVATGTSHTNRIIVKNPKWAATRRVTYDADSDEEEQVHQPASTAQSQPDLSLIIKSTEALARSCPRLKRVRSRAGNQSQAEASRPELSRPEELVDQTKVIQNPTPSADPNSNRPTQNEYLAMNKPTGYSEDDWIIIDPIDRSSRWYRGCYGRWIQLGERDWHFKAARVQPKNSIAYQPPFVHKPKATFMDLPAEIRNTIYEYVVPERSVLISRSHPKKDARHRQKSWSEEHIVANPPRSRLTHEPELDYSSDDFVDAVSLMLTCKEVKGEVETFLYSRILFCFHSLKSIRRFLQVGPETGMQSIRKVFIMQDGYGNSRTTENQKYRERYYRGWENVCALLGQRAASVKHLKLKVYDREWPAELSGKTYAPAWKTSMLKTSASLLPKVEVRIHHKMIDQNEEVLKDLARQIEDSMMSQEGRDNRDRLESERAYAEIAARKAAREEKERKRKAKLNAPPPPTELVITMDDVHKQADKATIMNKVRSKGLEKFDRIDPSIYNFHVETCG